MLGNLKKRKHYVFGMLLCLGLTQYQSEAVAFDPYYDATIHQQMMHDRMYGNRPVVVQQQHHYYNQPQPYPCPPRKWGHRQRGWGNHGWGNHGWGAPAFYAPPPRPVHYGGWGHNNFYRQNGTTITFGFW